MSAPSPRPGYEISSSSCVVEDFVLSNQELTMLELLY